MTPISTNPEEAVHRASEHLYEALTHHVGPVDFSTHDPLVLAISEYGATSRRGNDDEIRHASEHVYEALSHHMGPMDLGAHQPVVLALAEFGKACRLAGVKH